MSTANTRVRSHSSPAKMSKTPDITGSRIAEFVCHDLSRKSREQRISQSKPKLSQPAPAPAATSHGSSTQAPLKTKADFSNTAPVLKKVSSKPRKAPPVPPQGIDSRALRASIQRAVGDFLKKDGGAGTLPPDFFMEFYDIVSDCLAGQRMPDARAYGIFTGMVITLAPYLQPDEEATLEKLEKVSLPT